MKLRDIYQTCFPKIAKHEGRTQKQPVFFWPSAKIIIFFLVFIGASGFHIPQKNLPPDKVKILQKLTNPPNCNCTVSQGNFTSNLPFFIGTTNANAFYSYGTPLGTSANTGLEMSQTLLIFLYEDSTTGETSLFIILDRANDGSGGAGSVNFNCLPPTAFMSLADDPGEFTGTSPDITGTFSWNACCTDGGIIGGIGCGHTFTINPNLTSGINNFALVHGMPGQAEYIYLPEINCPITINCGGQPCCDEAFEITGSTTDASCTDVANGSINLTTICSNNPVFVWSNGESTEDLTDIAHGNYAVTVTDLNGCSERFTFEIDHGPSPEPEITGPDFFCTGATDPVTLTVEGSYSTYAWSSGQNTASVDVLTAGDYTVTVTDANGCTATDSVTISEHPVPEPEISGASEICPGEIITIDAGAGFESYAWSSGQNIQTINVSSPGLYTVTVTNEFSCTASAGTTIFALDAPEPDINAPPGICGEIPVTLDAGPGYILYNWSTGEDFREITVLYPGLYYVTVTNPAGCSAYDSVYINPLPVPEPVIQGLPYLCSGQSTYLDAGSGFISYAWSNGENNRAVEIFTPGTLQVTVTNAEGCEEVATVDIEEKENIVIRVFKTSCNPSDTGIFITNHFSQFGCDSMYIEEVSYSVSDSVRVRAYTCFPSEAGTFITTGINRHGCDSIHTREVIFLPPDTTLLFSGSCRLSETGIFTYLYNSEAGCDSLVIHTVSLLPSDSTWISRSTCNPSDTGLTTLKYVNRFGCDSLVVTLRTWAEADTTNLEKYTCDKAEAGVTERLLTSSGGCDSLIITNTLWISSDTTRTSSFTCDLAQTGEFIFHFTNQSGCDSMVINTVKFSPPDSTYLFFETCNPADTGITINRLVNQSGCDSLIFKETRLLPSSACQLDLRVLSDTIGCKETTGELQIFVENSSGEFSFTWQDQSGSTGSGIFVQAAAPVIIKDLTPGTYQITIRNEKGFYGIATAYVIRLQPLQIAVSVDLIYNGLAVSCHGAKDGSASVKVLGGGKPGYSYVWSDGSKTPEVRQLGAGVYMVTISDDYGCEKTDSVIITEPEPLQFRGHIVQPDCHNEEKGLFTFKDLRGGTSPYQFSIDGSRWYDQPTFTGLDPGLITCRIRDINGCLSETSILIREYEYPIILLARDTIIQQGDEITIKPVIISPGKGTYSLVWAGEDCSNCPHLTIKPDISRDVTVIITDSLGCEARATIKILVREKEIIYIPNIIRPGTNQNAYFTIYGSYHLQSVQDLSIYDRWGNKVFSGKNMPPNDPFVGWDGTFQGTHVQQGVYVFRATLLFTDGRSENYTGDITIVK